MGNVTNNKKDKIKKAMVVTHTVFRKSPPYDSLEGPYSSVATALQSLSKSVETLQIPISGFEQPIYYGKWKKSNKLKIPSFFGKTMPVKYLLDFLISGVFLLIFVIKNGSKNNLVVGVDPLSTLSLAILKPLLGHKLIYYCVDFNRNRFENKFLQYFYEKADEICSKLSDQTWVVCQSLKDYKGEKYGVDSLYMPNSAPFNPKFYHLGKKQKRGNKMAWTGSFLTDRQYEILFSILKEIQKNIRPDMEYYFAPMQNHEKFRDYGKKFGLKKSEVLELHSRAEWQEFAATCDTGIAIYDPKFGSTEFIEPLKIWDFMMCGMPFIISCEPSISNPIKESGVAFFLKPDNKLPKDDSIKMFLQKENIVKLAPECIKLAKKFDIQKQIQEALNKICF